MLKYSDIHLRAMAGEDLEIIRQWRNSDRVRINMYSDHVISPEEHANWFNRAMRDNSARYLICEINNRPVGFVSFTNIVPMHNRCSWAFYLGETDVPRGAGAAMEFIALNYSFEELGIRKLCCEVFTFNAGVIKLHEKFGFIQEGKFVKHHVKNGNYEDIVTLALFKENWDEGKSTLKDKCFSKDGD